MTLTDTLFDLVINPIIMKRRSEKSRMAKRTNTKKTPTSHFKCDSNCFSPCGSHVAHKSPREYNGG